MATLHDLLKARFSSVRRDLDQVLDHLTDDDLSWAPRDGMRTVGGQLQEIAGKDFESVAWIRTGVWPEDEWIEPATVVGWRSLLGSIRRETLGFIDSLSEEELEAPIANPDLWHEGLRIRDCPMSEVLRNIAAHEWYHTGQLVSYLWMRGDEPYGW